MTSPAATILIVDDKIQNRHLLEAMLRPAGYLTVVAASGGEALALIARRAPDLILLDVRMPVMDGGQLASILKADPATSNIPIIMVTAHSDTSSRVAGLRAGAEEFLTKPVDRVELWLRVRNLLRLKTLGDRLQNHSRILEQEVEARTQSLRDSESRFRQMADNIRDAFFLISATDGKILYVSPAYETIWGRRCDSLYADPRSWHEAVHPDDRERVTQTFAASAVSGHFDHEYRIVRPDDTQLWVRVRGYPIRDDAGTLRRIAAIAVDITASKEAAGRIAYLNRVYAMLSGINSLQMRVRDRGDLFSEACRIAVESGGFRMAWIGVFDRTEMKIVPLAFAGADEEIVAAIKDRFSTSLNGDALKDSMAAQVMREARSAVCNDTLIDPKVMFSRRFAGTGVRSMVMFPLIVADETVGLLALYAGEIEFFHAEEMTLLTELAGDLAFAIDHIEKRERLDYLAYYDVLTGLANRGLFLERVAQHLRSAVTGGHKLAVALLDLERFKNINDSLGRPAGDALLKQVAGWLTRNGGDANLLARVGADHFAAVLPEVRPAGDLARLIEKRMAALAEHPFSLNDAVFRVAVKVGVAVFPHDGVDADTLFGNAEAALKKAKASGERYLFYTRKMSDATAGNLTLENQLRRALENEEFVLHYQPKVSLASGKLTGAEALIRWNDPRTGLVPPARFIPILEETGLIYDVGRWALRKAIADYLRWRAAGLPAVRVAVNVSPLQLRNRAFVAEIAQIIGTDAHAAAGLELEITESLIMEDVRHSIDSLQAIRALGVAIAIDDFGTGFSSLSYLSKLPVDTLKIDRSFVVDMTAGPVGLSLVSTIISLAHALNLKVVAEGVETDEQSRLLRLLKCDEMQGYLFSKPVPVETFEQRFLAAPVSRAGAARS